MLTLTTVALFVAVPAAPAAAAAAWASSLQEERSLTLATTTSVRDAGLLEEIIPPFENASGYTVKILAVGSGHALELGRRGEADILILHDPDGELSFVENGFGVMRTLFMRNEYFLVGPPDDRAGVRGLTSAKDAFARIADTRSLFLSRGDSSGTNVKETAIWSLTGKSRDPSWYWESGQGMGATLQIAAERDLYTLTDIGTYLNHPASSYLEIMVERDTLLANQYHILLVNPDRFEWIHHRAALELRAYLISGEVQEAVGAYRRAEFGRSLFTPAALEHSALP